MKPLAAVIVFLGALVAFPAHRSRSSQGQARPGASVLLGRRYQEGQKLTYYMTATDEDQLAGTKSYAAQANGIVKKDSAGHFYEEYRWSGIVWNGQAVPVPAGFRQIVSLDPSFGTPLPDLRQAVPGLVGPVLDFMTFYVDLELATRQGGLHRPGEHAYVKFGKPSSWAAGDGVILGETSIDFDITLASVNREADVATLLVRHVPPAQPQIQLPAAWMHTPVADTPNNHVEVRKNDSGKYIVSIGKETFDDVIKISLTDGRILSATMDNPVEVLQRECSDAALTLCGKPIRYHLRRQIEIHQ